MNSWWSQLKTAGSAIYANRHYLELYRQKYPERLAAAQGTGDPPKYDCTIQPDVHIDPTAVIHPTAVVSTSVRSVLVCKQIEHVSITL